MYSIGGILMPSTVLSMQILSRLSRVRGGTICMDCGSLLHRIIRRPRHSTSPVDEYLLSYMILGLATSFLIMFAAAARECPVLSWTSASSISPTALCNMLLVQREPFRATSSASAPPPMILLKMWRESRLLPVLCAPTITRHWPMVGFIS